MRALGGRREQGGERCELGNGLVLPVVFAQRGCRSGESELWLAGRGGAGSDRVGVAGVTRPSQWMERRELSIGSGCERGELSGEEGVVRGGMVTDMWGQGD